MALQRVVERDVGLALPPKGLVAEPHGAERVICICADDFGLREGVNEAILTLLDAGRVQAVSCMVGGLSWRLGAAALRRRDPDHFDAGLHLDLTERPLLQASRQPLSRLVLASMMRWSDARALRREVNAQLDAFEDAFGAPPAYVDGHQHVHQLPVVREALISALTDRYGPRLPWVRSTLPGQPSPKARLIRLLGGGRFLTAAGSQGFRHNERLLGVYDFRGGAPRYRALLSEWLSVAHSGDLLMCHPGIGADDLDGIAAARRAEFTVLADPAFAALLRAQGITLRPACR